MTALFVGSWVEDTRGFATAIGGVLLWFLGLGSQLSSLQVLVHVFAGRTLSKS